MDSPKAQLYQEGIILANRLERLSADSHWSHRASGLRGALLRSLEVLGQDEAVGCFSSGEVDQAWQCLPGLIFRGQLILQQAARAIRTPDTQFD